MGAPGMRDRRRDQDEVALAEGFDRAVDKAHPLPCPDPRQFHRLMGVQRTVKAVRIDRKHASRRRRYVG